MTTSKIDNSQRTAAKVAGFAGLFAVATVVYSNYALLSPLLVRGNAAETARNIMAHETQFRVAATCFLTYSVSVIVLLAALYVILKSVNQVLALLGALFRLIFALLWLLSTINMLGALRLLGDTGYLHVFEADRLQVLARAFRRRNFRRLLCWPAIFRAGRDRLRLVVAQVELHPERTGYLRCDLVGVVRDLCVRLPHFPRIRQASESDTGSIRQWRFSR